ncbi:MAG: hypothetical protein COV01_00680 [Candidatus Taylorbacteria bacterium CG10_big_fil_rev_8_21_14_0_10_41_48]|uniref:Uncharacterized protein n=1 Tax=Candidatus Taylorbacteria bacterium CG10_big_fil_rev_8_21_14_0_10_41_48 TaxID=1975024 RepID=A0A2M8LD27_9BACT|nr:MAG: hypothetical protein COV01_00680 [Candidatus Taylorbacteria bacterium CG10_big_fil_rev_8_21_14_0_10_41_48]
MSHKTTYTIIFLLVVILAVFGWYFFFIKSTPTPISDTTSDNSDLFPFGSNTSNDSGQIGTVKPNNGQGSTTIDLSGSNSALQPRLRKVSDDQVSGAILFDRGGFSVIHYMDRATGHIFESNADTVTKTKISNITMPKIYETLWSNDGLELIARYLKDDGVTIQSFYGVLPATTTSNSSVEGYFLPSNIKELSLFDKKVIYLDPTQNGILVSSNIDGGKKVLSTNLYSRDWLLTLANTKTALVGTKPSGLVGGDLYVLDIATGIKTKIMTDILGLTGTISPDGNRVFASAEQGGGVASAIYSISDKKMDTLSLKTLSDKCAWSSKNKTVIYCAVPVSIPNGVYPDDWYQGTVSFSDRLWKINTTNQETDLLLDPSIETGYDMDMIKLYVGPSDSQIIFINKKDSSLWVLDIQE